MGIYLSRNDFVGWNQNDPNKYSRVWNVMETMLHLRQDASKDSGASDSVRPLQYAFIRMRFSEELMQSKVEEILDRITDTVRRLFDNWHNQGDQSGGQLWEYEIQPEILESDMSNPPGVFRDRPPGLSNDRLRSKLPPPMDEEEADEEKELLPSLMYRRYRGMSLYDDPTRHFPFKALKVPGRTGTIRYLWLVKCVFHQRLVWDIKRQAGKAKRSGNTKSDSLDELSNAGREIGVDEPGYAEVVAEQEDVVGNKPDSKILSHMRDHVVARATIAHIDIQTSIKGTPGVKGKSPKKVPFKLLTETHRFLRYVLYLSCGDCALPLTELPLYSDWDEPTDSNQNGSALGMANRLDLTRYLVVIGQIDAAAKIDEGDDGLDTDDRVSEEEPRPELYRQWHNSCMKISQKRDAIDAALSRMKPPDALNAFYETIGHSDENAGCLKAREFIKWFASLSDGDIAPGDATQCRAHLQECAECFWAFSDYVADRVSWGYRPQPAVAALRERLRASQWRLTMHLGELPTWLPDMLARWRQEIEAVPFGPALVPISAQDETEQRLPAGLPLRVGEIIRMDVLNSDGHKTVTATAEVISVEYTLSEGGGQITLLGHDLPPSVGVLAARLEAFGRRFTLAADWERNEDRQLTATLTLTDFPAELGASHIQAWYAVEAPPRPAE